MLLDAPHAHQKILVQNVRMDLSSLMVFVMFVLTPAQLVLVQQTPQPIATV